MFGNEILVSKSMHNENVIFGNHVRMCQCVCVSICVKTWIVDAEALHNVNAGKSQLKF